MNQSKKPWLALLLLSCLISACSGEPSSTEPPAPAWVHQAARTVDGGYIVYVGVGEDRLLERSRFKSEAMALQDLANECSFAPKGARVEDHFDETVGVLHRSYAKASIEFSDCEAAKAALTPEKIRELANSQYTDEIKKYQDMIDEPEPEEEEDLAAAPTSTNPNGGGGTVVVASNSQYFVVRQQIAFYKQDVILAPATAYPPYSPVATTPPPALAAATSQVSGYEAVHPEMRTSNQAFSTQRPNAIAHQPGALRERGAQAHSPRRSAGPRSGNRPRQPNRRRRRRRER